MTPPAPQIRRPPSAPNPQKQIEQQIRRQVQQQAQKQQQQQKQQAPKQQQQKQQAPKQQQQKQQAPKLQAPKQQAPKQQAPKQQAPKPIKLPQSSSSSSSGDKPKATTPRLPRGGQSTGDGAGKATGTPPFGFGKPAKPSDGN